MTRSEFGWLALGLIVGFLVWEEWRGSGCAGCGGGKRPAVTPITVTATSQTPHSCFPLREQIRPQCGGC
jgi:hypothetical protein